MQKNDPKDRLFGYFIRRQQWDWRTGDRCWKPVLKKMLNVKAEHVAFKEMVNCGYSRSSITFDLTSLAEGQHRGPCWSVKLLPSAAHPPVASHHPPHHSPVSFLSCNDSNFSPRFGLFSPPSTSLPSVIWAATRSLCPSYIALSSLWWVTWSSAPALHPSVSMQ